MFRDKVAEFTGNELLKLASVDHWDILFEEFCKKKTERKMILVMDEFQYLCKANKAFSSIMQRVWENILKEQNVMLILCGSHMSMMEAETLNYRSPLYGRRTAQILLKQIPFQYYDLFFEGKTEEELAMFYSVTGGVPKYIEQFDDSDDIYTAIEENILDQSSFLYDEPNFLLRNELGEVGTYFSIIKAIAAGNKKVSKIAEVMEEKQTSISSYLQTLMNLDILEREVPITEENPGKSKKGLYKIKDNYILFWFKFIYPNMGLIESGQKDIVLQKIKENFIVNHVAHIYEYICIEQLKKINGSPKLGFSYNAAGRWWDNKTEIDIVAFNSQGNEILFGECKFRKQKMDTDVFYELREKAKSVKWKNENRVEKYVLFSIRGYTDGLLEVAEKSGDVILF